MLVGKLQIGFLVQSEKPLTKTDDQKLLEDM